MKKIGDYLIENKICDESLLDSALQEQAELKSKGIFKPLTAVLLDSNAVSPKDLDKAISIMHLNILSSSALFQSISREALKKTLSKGQSTDFPEESIIFNQGEESKSFFIVISGTVKIFRTGADKQESIIAYLKEGE